MSQLKYEPKVLENKTDKEIEFRCGGHIYIFKPGERKPLDGFVAYHALKVVNTGLTEVGAKKEVKMDVPLKDMSWKQLRQMVDKEGKKIYKMGMNRKELEEAIEKCLS